MKKLLSLLFVVLILAAAAPAVKAAVPDDNASCRATYHAQWLDEIHDCAQGNPSVYINCCAVADQIVTDMYAYCDWKYPIMPTAQQEMMDYVVRHRVRSQFRQLLVG